MKIHLTEPAANDLRKIEKYIQQDNPTAASRTVFRVLEAIEYLISYPMMGRIGRILKTRELVVSGTPFIVIYRLHPHTILVLRILHTSRKWP